MPVDVKLGRRPAVDDPRIPAFHDVAATATLPTPPASVNWYAGVESWGMLGNDTVGDCVEAAVGHAILQFTTYAGAPLVPTTAEAIKFYSEATGYIPGKPATDQGSYVMGPGGVMQFWANQGVTYGGVLNKASAFMKFTLPGPNVHWKQAIHYFGGVLLGIDLPEAIVAGNTIPYVWSDFSGPVAGGHEIWIPGYQVINGTTYFDLVSWGGLFRATRQFLAHVTREAVCVYDTNSLNSRGLNPDDFDATQLLADMSALRAIA